MACNELNNEILPVSAKELQEAILQETPIILNVKSESPLKSSIHAPSVVQRPQNQRFIQRVRNLGVGTVTIEKKIAEKMAFGNTFGKFKKVPVKMTKRCGNPRTDF